MVLICNLYIGAPNFRPFVYRFLGFYSGQDIADNNDDPDNDVPTLVSHIPIQTGDLKYKDLYGDGEIDNFDKKAIGKPNLPNTTLGRSLEVYYKGFTVNILLYGSFNYSFSIVGTGIELFQSQFQPVHLGY